jgi:aminopeptidase 2
MGQTWHLGACVALLLLINITSANVIPLRELQFNPDRYSESRGTRAGEEYRLPKTVKPEFYQITLTPDFDGFNFTGTVDITTTAISDTKNISLHYDSITVNNVTVTGSDGADIFVSHNYTEDTDIFTITLSTELKIGENYTIHIDYTGILHDDMAGFYRSSYITADGEQRYIY